MSIPEHIHQNVDGMVAQLVVAGHRGNEMKQRLHKILFLCTHRIGKYGLGGGESKTRMLLPCSYHAIQRRTAIPNLLDNATGALTNGAHIRSILCHTQGHHITECTESHRSHATVV